ncbi:MAG: hypothetical protein IK086_02870 [Clostridia bacterium]|nr:hypothetical protein [Clostridia bacterium]
MKQQETKQQNRVEINLLTHEKQESPLFLDDESFDVSASVLANMMLDFVRVNGADQLTPGNVFRKEQR